MKMKLFVMGLSVALVATTVFADTNTDPSQSSAPAVQSDQDSSMNAAPDQATGNTGMSGTSSMSGAAAPQN